MRRKSYKGPGLVALRGSSLLIARALLQTKGSARVQLCSCLFCAA